MKYDEKLAKGAKFHSEQMIELDFFSHFNRKNRKVKTPADRAKKFKSDMPIIGENIIDEIAMRYKDNALYDPVFKGEKYTYLDYKTKKKITELTYDELAKKMVTSWMNSLHTSKIFLVKSISTLVWEP